MSNMIPLDGRAWCQLTIGEQSGTVAFDRHGAVLGYAGAPVCRDCGAAHDSRPIAH